MDHTDGMKTKIESSPSDNCEQNEDLELLDKPHLLEKICTLKDCIENHQSQISLLKEQVTSAKDAEERLKQQLIEANRREHFLLMRLSAKDQELQNLINQNRELKQAQIPSEAQLLSTLLDPALNLMFEKMKKEVIASREKVEQMHNELSAWTFTSDSHMGKQLMAKCQSLYKENEELGKAIASGRIGKLEGEIALQKSFVEDMKKSQLETDEFLFELDEEVEAMQATIVHLQQQLLESKQEVENTAG